MTNSSIKGNYRDIEKDESQREEKPRQEVDAAALLPIPDFPQAVPPQAQSRARLHVVERFFVR